MLFFKGVGSAPCLGESLWKVHLMCCQNSPLLYGLHGAITTEKEGERSFNVSQNTVFSLSVLHFSSHTFLFGSSPSVLEPCSVRT